MKGLNLQEISLLLALLLNHLHIDGLFLVFHHRIVTAGDRKVSSAVANERDTGKNVLLIFYNSSQVMENEQKITDGI